MFHSILHSSGKSWNKVCPVDVLVLRMPNFFPYQVLEELDFFNIKRTLIMVGGIFVLSPIPGNIAGAWYVQRYLGGYTDRIAGMRFTTLMAMMAFGSCLLLTAAAILKIHWGVRNRQEVWLLYVVAFFAFLFFGAAPTAVINGIAVRKISFHFLFSFLNRHCFDEVFDELNC